MERTTLNMIFISFNMDYGSKYWNFTTISKLSTHNKKNNNNNVNKSRTYSLLAFDFNSIVDFNRKKRWKESFHRYLVHFFFSLFISLLIIKIYIYILCIKLMENSCTTSHIFLLRISFENKCISFLYFENMKEK